MGIRISLIKYGVGIQRFIRSRNVVSQARAYFLRRHISDIDYRELSNNLLIHCIIDGKLYPRTARIYQRHFERFCFMPHEKKKISGHLMRSIEVHNDPGYAVGVTELMLMLDIPF